MSDFWTGKSRRRNMFAASSLSTHPVGHVFFRITQSLNHKVSMLFCIIEFRFGYFIVFREILFFKSQLFEKFIHVFHGSKILADLHVFLILYTSKNIWSVLLSMKLPFINLLRQFFQKSCSSHRLFQFWPRYLNLS